MSYPFQLFMLTNSLLSPPMCLTARDALRWTVLTLSFAVYAPEFDFASVADRADAATKEESWDQHLKHGVEGIYGGTEFLRLSELAD